MVRFEKEKLVIEVSCYNPHDVWLELHGSLCDLIRFVNKETLMGDSFGAAVDFLGELMPDRESAKSMPEKGGAR